MSTSAKLFMAEFRRANLNSNGKYMIENIYSIDDIDWNGVWRKNVFHVNSDQSWDKRVESFSAHAIDSPYAANFIAFLKPQPHWTVFDMGCGSGTLALPLALKVKAVTAADFSSRMLAALQNYAAARQINNISTLKLSWTDNWSMVLDKSYDVAIASRSLLVEDFKGAIEKLAKIARKYVYLVLLVDSGKEHDLVYQALGRRLKTPLDYCCCYNILYQMGIRANINILTEHVCISYATREAAVDAITEKYVKDLNEQEMTILKTHVNNKLAQNVAGWHHQNPLPYRCAVVWWEL